MLHRLESGGLTGGGAASLAGHQPAEAVKLVLRVGSAVEVAKVKGNQHFPEPCYRGFLGPEVVRRLCTGHDPLRCRVLECRTLRLVTNPAGGRVVAGRLALGFPYFAEANVLDWRGKLAGSLIV
jgi:hypothetical protein